MRADVTLVAMAAWCLVTVANAAVPGTVDLTTLDDLAAAGRQPRSVWDDVPIEPVAATRDGDRRWYVTGMLGESFATLADPIYAELHDGGWLNRSVITAGGAAGVAFERENGRLRVEAEGRWRDDVIGRFSDPNAVGPGVGATLGWAATDGWSALVNVWRDYAVGEHVDVYLGGGIGGGGYRYGVAGQADFPGEGEIRYASDAQVAEFAWQVGGGVIWNLSDRVAFDVGYRFYSIGPADTTLVARIGGFPIGAITVPQQFTASELLFGLRIYEPFRRWR